MPPPLMRPRRDVVPFLAGFAVAIMLTTLRMATHTSTPMNGSAYRDSHSTWKGQQSHQSTDQTDLPSRKKVVAVIGTGFTTDRSNPKYNYSLRRQALRNTWFPPSQSALDKLEASTGIVMRFVIGHSQDSQAEEEIAEEEREYGGFLRLPLEEAYLNLTNKTLTFFRTVVQQYDPQYIIKADDDVFLRVDRVPAAIAQWQQREADYIGCMKTGNIITSNKYRWFEPQHAVLGSQSYFTHCWGTIYVLSGRAAELLRSIDPSLLRFFANEDVTVGSWMLAMDIKHFDDRRLCETDCTSTSIAVFDFPTCAGLCDASTKLPELYNSPNCKIPAVQSDGTLSMLPPVIDFTIQD